MRDAFHGASNMAYNAADAPDLSGVADMSHMFNSAIRFNGDLSSWDVSQVTDMSGMFADTRSFNGDLSSWDVSQVTDMSGMFHFATSFNGDLSSWDVSQVTDMSGMFRSTSFNGDLSSWDVSQVTDMSHMFNSAIRFNGDLSSWNVSQATDMSGMFAGTRSFNGDLSSWNVSQVTDMSQMFAGTRSFNGNLSSWNVSQVTDMSHMFNSAIRFNGNLSSWDVSAVTNMRGMFVGASSFEQNLGNWYIVPDGTTVDTSEVPGTVATISAQNAFMDNQNPTYGMGTGDDSDSFSINGTNLVMDTVPNKRAYIVNVTSTGHFGDNNHRILEISVTGNRPPAADAGDDMPVLENVTVTLNGTGSSDPDGDPLSYMWTQTAGPDVTLSDSMAAKTDFTSPYVTGNTILTFSLEVSDGNATDTAAVVITVEDTINKFPSANAGEDQDVNENEMVTLNGTGSTDPDHGTTLTYEWSQTSGHTVTLSNATAASPSFTAPAGPAVLAFLLNVTDGSLSSTDAVNVTVAALDNNPPVADAFITTWTTAEANQAILLPVSGSGITINWGDGATVTGVSGPQSHTYGSAGNWTVTVTGGLERFHLNKSQSSALLSSIDQWGNSSWTSMENAFYGASEMAYSATDAPDLSGVASTAGMFREASSFNGNISSWDVSRVTNMSRLFQDASSFNQPLNAWNVSAVTDMFAMFFDASSFNQPLNAWDVSAVTTMRSMFTGAHSFNQPLNAWDVSAVTTMRSMFFEASSFNQTLNAWDVSAVTTMRTMFHASSFNQTLDGWDVSAVTNMHRMFSSARSFNQPLNAWDVSAVTDMSNMFYSAHSFNQTLDGWDVSSVTNMQRMFTSAHSFNGNISSWDVSAVTDMSDMFHQASSFNQPLNAWDVSSVTTMRAMFQNASSFNQPLNAWNVSAVTDMYQMFAKASSFNQPLGSWDVSSVTEMHNMFGSYPSFGQNLGPWYIVPDDPRPAVSAVDRVAANITAQNPFLSGQGPDYRVTGDHADLFEMAGAGNATLQLKPNQAAVSGTTYNVTVAATGDSLFGADNARTVQVTVRNAHNSPPTADAGDDQDVNEGDTVTLDGTGSSDPDEDPLTYRWTHNYTQPITLANATTATTAFTAPSVPANTTIQFTLTAADSHNATASDTVHITVRHVNKPPAVYAGPDLRIYEGVTITLVGYADDPDGDDFDIPQWTHQPASPAITVDEDGTFTAPQVSADTTYTFNLTTTDEHGLSASDTAIIRVLDNDHTRIDPSLAGSILDNRTISLKGPDYIDIFNISGVPYAAVAAYEDGAVTTINLSDPDNPAISGTVTVKYANGLDIFHTSDIPYAAVTSYDDPVLSIINLSDPANPSVAGSIENENATDDVAVFETSDNTWAVTASSSNAFSVFNLNDPANPTLAGSIGVDDLTPTRMDISYVSGIPYVVVTASFNENVHVLNMSNPANPTHAAVVASDAPFYVSPLRGVTGIAAFDVSGAPYAAAAGATNGVFQVINLNDPANPTLHGNFTDYYWLNSINYLDIFEWSGTTWAAATSGSGDVHVFDLTDPANPALASNATRLLDPTIPYEIATFRHSGNIYAAVASQYDSGVHTVRITANDPPDVRAGPDQTVAEQQTVTLTGTVTDSDSPIEYHWTHNGTGLGVTLDDDRAAATTFTAPSVAADTTIRFTLTAADSHNATASDAVDITVTDTVNQPPAADAGEDQDVNENEMVTLNGTGSTDPDWGTVLTYDWTHNGTDLGITLSNTAVAEPTFTSPYVAANTTITFRLEVSDGTDTDTDTVDITVKDTTNRPPTADAGDDQDANEGDTVTLDGTGSTDPDRGTTLTYEWSQTSGHTVTLSNATAASPSFTAPDGPAILIFELNVTDGSLSSTDAVNVTVAAPDNNPPVADAFITTWTTAEANQAILLPVSGSGITINWGDGATVTGVSGPQSHTYGSAGNWTVTVTGGLERFHLNKSQSSALLSSIDQWGNSSWTSMENAFYGASEMAYSATDAPDLSGVASTAGMFREASSFNGNISSWDVSRVTNMSRLFQDASSFNQPLNAWDVSAVTDMSNMFYSAHSFNQTLNAWDVSAVTTMRSMFTSAHSFNQPLNAWDVSAVTTMRSMFFEASSFNQPLNAWDVSSVTTMRTMFHASSFNQPLDGWDVSSVTNMQWMFSSARSFNQPLNAWNVSAVTDMSNMFYTAHSFNQPLDGWDVSSVTNMQWMFTAASSFNQPLNAWNVSGVTTMHRMFGGATSFNQTLDGWDVSAVTNMHRMFTGANSFNQPLDAWDVSSVTNMQRMFTSAHSFNGNISSWDVSAVTDMSDMFHQASSFNQPLGSWDVSSVTTMRAMFQDASSFNQPLNAWNVSAVTDMYQMFAKASSFNQPLGSWDVSSVTEMHNMFGSYPSFGQNLGPWYIVPDDPRPAVSAVDRVAANITAQNPFLSGQGPDYRVTGDHADLFEMAGAGNATLQLKPNQAAVSGTTYNVTVAATGDSLFGADNARTVQVTVRNAHNSPPTADAGDDQDVNEGDTVTLNGTGSSDPDSGDSISYLWSQTSGTTVTLSNATAAAPTFTAPTGPAILIFELNVTDGSLSSTDAVNVTVAAPANRMPVADAGEDQDVASGAAVTLNGTGSSDPDSGDSISYLWSQTSGTTVTLSNATAAAPTFTAPTGPAILIFELNVTDGSLSSTDTVNVTVAAPANRMPVADAGEDQDVASGAAVTLDGTGSSDPDSGDSISYLWSQTSGTTVTLSNATAAEPTFTAPDGPAILIFELNVTDGSLSSTDTVNVTVAAPANRMPVADAGEDQDVASGAAVTLDGTGSSDPDSGDSISYLWNQTSGTTVTLSNATAAAPTFTAPTGPAILIFELNVTDGSLSSTDTVNVTVAAPANRMPVADAGEDQDVASGAAVTLDGTGSSDPDSGDSISYLWNQTSGTTVTLSNATAAAPTFTAPTGPAILIFELNVTDGSLSSTDTVNVTVAAPANRMPVADAGEDQDVNEGDTVTLDGTGSSDPDSGDSISYSWNQTSGTTVTLSNATAADPRPSPPRRAPPF